MYVYLEENILQLTNPLKFQNTTIIPGSRHIPAVKSRDFKAKSYFSGYVFRGESRPPEIIFAEGFMLQYPVKSMDQVIMMTGISPDAFLPGFTGSEGISTSVSLYEASKFAMDIRVGIFHGYVYLIDAMCMAGFVVYDDPATLREPPVPEEINEVCFLSFIPNTSVVGLVWPAGFHPPPITPRRWPEEPLGLNLAVNPEYCSGFEKGLTAAQKVVGLFNA